MALVEYPKEYIVPLIGENDFLGRVTVNSIQKGFSVEVDVVTVESRKIFKHIDVIYNIENEQEAINTGVDRLAKYLRSLKK